MGDTTESLLKEFLEHDGIRSYDSTLCWGCNQPKAGACEPDCLLERSRKVIACAALKQSAVILDSDTLYYGVMPRGLPYCIDHDDSHTDCAVAIAARESNTEEK